LPGFSPRTPTLEVIESAGKKLGLAVANMITLLNPEMHHSVEGTDLGGTFWIDVSGS